MGRAMQLGTPTFCGEPPARGFRCLGDTRMFVAMMASSRVLALGILMVSGACSSGDPAGDESDSGLSEGSAADTSTGPASSTTTGEETAADESDSVEPTYRAVFVPGTPNELRILQADPSAGRCTWLVLTDDPLGWLAIATPSGWNARATYTNEVPTSCAGDPRTSGYSEGSHAMGTIVATAEGTLAPCSIDVDATLEFASESFTATFAAVGLAVEGCM